MLKKVTTLLFMVVLVFSLSVSGFAKGKGEEKVEGHVVRRSNDNSTLTVRLVNGNGVEKIVHYDASTGWNSKYHGAKKVNTIEASQIKDDDYVICLGASDDKGQFHATSISKRLSHSPQ